MGMIFSGVYGTDSGNEGVGLAWKRFEMVRPRGFWRGICWLSMRSRMEQDMKRSLHL